MGPLGRIFGGVLERLGQFLPVAGNRRGSAGADTQGPLLRIFYFLRIILVFLIDIIRNKDQDWLGYGTLYAMRRPTAWRGGSKAQQSCVPATAPSKKVTV